MADGNALVTRFGESEVLVIGNEADVRKLFADHLHGSIRRRVIDDDQFGGNDALAFKQTLNIFFEKLLHVPAHDYHRQIRRGLMTGREPLDAAKFG